MTRLIHKIINIFTQYYKGPGILENWLRRRVNFYGSYKIEENKKGSRFLLVIIAGYKSALWDMVFPRIIRFTPNSFDVCIITPGKYEARLSKIAKENNWSYLWTRSNKVALAQNLAIREHPNASEIFKMDEDIFISENSFEELLELYKVVDAKKEFDIGFVAPLLNVNGFSYRLLLEALNKKEDYLETFKDVKSSHMHTSAWSNPKAAEYLWRLIHPLDETSRSLKVYKNEYAICPHRFSIGFIYFKRTLWESMYGFTVMRPGLIGTDETDLCVYCMENSLHIVISKSVLAGHFSFGPQTNHMNTLLETSPYLFKNLSFEPVDS